MKNEPNKTNTETGITGGLAIQPVEVTFDLSGSMNTHQDTDTPTNSIPTNTNREQQPSNCCSGTICLPLAACLTYVSTTSFSSTNNGVNTSTDVGPFSNTQTVGVSGGNLNTRTGSSFDCLGCYITNNQQTSSFGSDGISQSESNSVSCFGLESENSTNCSIGSDGCDCGYSCNNCGVGCGFDESISCPPISSCSLFSCDVPTLPSASCTDFSSNLSGSCCTLFNEAGNCLSEIPLDRIAEGTIEVVKGTAGCLGAVLMGVLGGN